MTDTVPLESFTAEPTRTQTSRRGAQLGHHRLLRPIEGASKFAKDSAAFLDGGIHYKHPLQYSNYLIVWVDLVLIRWGLGLFTQQWRMTGTPSFIPTGILFNSLPASPEGVSSI